MWGEPSVARGSLLDGTVIVALAGSFDGRSGILLERELADAELGRVDVILHVTAGSYVDATGVAAIARTAETLRRHGASLVLVSDDPRIRRLTEADGAGFGLPLVGTLNEAVGDREVAT
jgi:anti-anti-sigma factor